LHWSEPLQIAPASELTDEPEIWLTRLVRSKTTSVRHAEQARMVLLAAWGKPESVMHWSTRKMA
jgi:hypothetical protein